MSRLPQPGGDDGQWGQILNDFLSQAHNPDGSLKPLTESQIQNLTSDLAAKANATDVVANTDLDTKTAALINNGASATSAGLKAALVPGSVYNSDGSLSTTKRLHVKLTADGTDIDDLFIETVG